MQLCIAATTPALLIPQAYKLQLLATRKEDQEKRTEQAQILQMRSSLRQNLSDRLFAWKIVQSGWGGRASSGSGNTASFNVPWYTHS